MITNAGTLPVLVDYDNVDRALLAAPLHSIAGALLMKFPSHLFDHYQTVDFRLYGGWYGPQFLTQRAQTLVPAIASDFPRAFGVTNSTGASVQLRAHMHLAATPLFASKEVLYETYAKHRSARDVRCATKPWSNCADASNCGMAALESVMQAGHCKAATCATSVRDILVRDEQKLVDTLLVTDLAHLALKEARKHAVVVSSDADMWPGILLAAVNGCAIFHLHPNPGYKTQARLLATTRVAPSMYTTASI